MTLATWFTLCGVAVVGGAGAGAAGLQHVTAAAQADRLVWHPRHRLALSPGLCPQPRPAAGAAS